MDSVGQLLKRQTFSDGAGDSVEQRIKNLERETDTALNDVALAIEKKYVDCIAELCASNELLETIRSTCTNAQQMLDAIANDVESTDAELKTQKHATARLVAVKEFKMKMQHLEEVEMLIHQMWCSSNEDSALINSQLINELENKLKIMNEDVASADEVFIHRICPALSAEVITLRQGLLHVLDTFWKDLFSVQETENGEIRLKILCCSAGKASEKLSAMAVLDVLDTKISKLCTYLVDSICRLIILAKNPKKVFTYMGATTIVNVKHEYIFCKDTISDDGQEKHGPPSSIFETLLEFFKCFHSDIDALNVNGKKFVELIGGKITTSLTELIVAECLTPAIPDDQDGMERFNELTNQAEAFGKELEKMGFFIDSKSFQGYAESYNSTFINRRCTKIIVEARSLIEAPLTEFVTVGKNKDNEQETIEEFIKAGSLPHERSSDCEEQFPKLLQFQRCQVSQTVVKLVDLISLALNAASDADSELAAGRLLQTSRNILELYVHIAPCSHDAEISSVPLLAGVFYNNCYYICHRLMTIGVDFIPKVEQALNLHNLSVTYVDYIPKLREIAAGSMEKQLAQCRRQLSTLLADEKMFKDLENPIEEGKCLKCLSNCISHLEQISGIWKSVLAETVYANCIGNLVTFFLNRVIKLVICMEDIPANDAEIIVIALKKVLTHCEQLFVDISDRWCDGKGLLAHWLTRNDVRHLIKALFQNTDYRASMLSKIN